MIAFVSLIAQFRRDERGVFAVIFGIMAVVLVALSGAVVDLVSMEQARTRAQVALDAAALALQGDVFLTPLNAAAIKTKAQGLMDENNNDDRVTAVVANPTINVAEGSLLLTADLKIKTIFVALVGVSEMKARISSQATRKQLKLEVILALDNSGSMSWDSRMVYLKQAAKCATNILFYNGKVDATSACNPLGGATMSPDVKMGIVPFNTGVNVGASNSGQAWIDTNGISPIANDNFDNDDNDATPFTGAVNRLALYTSITNDDWRGCIEARPHVSTVGGNSNRFYDTDDTVPTAADPSSLFVPQFAPDNSESTTSLGSGNNYTDDAPPSCNRIGATVKCTWKEVKKGCSSYGSCTGTITNTYTFAGPTSPLPYPQACDCPGGTWSSDTGTNSYTGGWPNRTYTRTRVCNTNYIPVYNPPLSERELQERLCKYTGAALSYTTGAMGPNQDCPNASILPLTATPASVHTAIDAMTAYGATNIHEGAAWGFRALSPTEPFTQGTPYAQATSKTLIVMTDGENTAYPTGDLNGADYYSPYGYPYNSNNAAASYGSNINRLGAYGWTATALQAEMNVRTAQACTNAKAAGIKIYTIGLATQNTSDPATITAMLTACASAPENAYFPADPAELNDVFKAIAGQLGQLRIAQ